MQSFDFNEALKAIQSGKLITGSDVVLAPLIEQLTEAALSAEIDSYLELHLSSTGRNGYSKKTIKLAVGSFELETPRDVTATGNFIAQEQTTGYLCSLIYTIVVYKIF